MMQPSLHRFRRLATPVLLARVAWGALCAAHASWLIRALLQDATLSRVGPLLMAAGFLAFLTLRPRAINICIERRAVITWSLVVGMMHINVAQRSINPADDTFIWAVPVVVGSFAAATQVRPLCAYLRRRAAGVSSGGSRLRLFPINYRSTNEFSSIFAQRGAYVMAAPRAPPSTLYN